jgi:SNF2 family DNA or RNA helicase
MNNPFASPKYAKALKELLSSKGAVRVQFSEGTYQIEVGKKERFWPFLQLSDQGVVLDSFCSCSATNEPCVHLAASYETIFRGALEPLHVRFRSSFWNQLCQMACHRHGYDASVLKKSSSGYRAASVTGKQLFVLKGKTLEGKKRLKELLFDRAVETEETSLKFSNLSPEEIGLWKAGRPSESLQYELCFWSDLAKWMMLLQEEGARYKIRFEGAEGKLPQWAHSAFPSFEVSFYIAEANWQRVIPSLPSVNTPFTVHEFQAYRLQALHYDIKRRCLFVEKTDAASEPSEKSESGIAVGEWVFVPSQGFFPQRLDSAFDEEAISQHKIGALLSKYPAIVRKYLVGIPFHSQGQRANYDLYFDGMGQLHIVCYLFQKGDLLHEDSTYFGPWVYLHNKGFYCLEEILFEGVEKIITHAQMNDFINHHRVFLNGFEGFATHVYRIESNLHFSVSQEGELRFFALVDMLDHSEEMIDFGEWIYLKEKGFFSKKVGKGVSPIPSQTCLQKHQVAPFIRLHKEELEAVKGFFTTSSPLEKSGLNIILNATGGIEVYPHFAWESSLAHLPIQLFEEFVYVPAQGFFEIPQEQRLPEAYLKPKSIAEEDEAYFVLCELEVLRPWILSIPDALKKPHTLALLLHRFQKSRSQRATEWVIEAELQTDVGSEELFSVWKAVQENRRYLFSTAGCLLLKQPRFNWLKTITKKQWLLKGKRLRLTTLQWLRLSAFEEIHVAKEEEKQCLQLQELFSLQTDKPPDLTGFKSELRSYQEAGVKWLWFLFQQGLSGLLCDEMGLGKTHQAMGLIAAIKNDRKAKILVICPTSVIYHWETLLKTFLPSVRVSVFYGIQRSLELFHEEVDLLLTSYGTLRGEISALSQIEFDLAIFDELQLAKNHRSQTHRALKKIKAQMRLGLSGTPIENRLLELKALFDLIVPTYLPQEAQFKELFVNPIEKNQDPEKKKLLSRLIQPFILRRKKSEVLKELPEKIEEIAYCDLSEEQSELYKKTYLLHKQSLFKELDGTGESVPYLHVFSLLSSLKQICDHPCLITKDYAQFQQHKSGKWDLFVELLQEIRDSGQKVVIFSQYLNMLDMIQAYLDEHKIGYAGIRGSTRDRKEQLEKFRQDPTCEVFVASLQAVGVGVDLVSASVVIHYDRWWNPARENQATDRVHRIGQNRGVQVFKMVTKGTIEEHIHRLIEKKLTLMEGVIGFDEQDQIKGLNKEELMALLRQIDQDVR